jgi:hypothetical protein
MTTDGIFIYLLFIFGHYNFKNLGRVIYWWKGLQNTFPTIYYTPQNAQNCSRKNKKQMFVVVEWLQIMLVKRTATNFGCGVSGHSFLLVEALQKLQLLSLTKWLFIHISFIHDKNSLQKCRMQHIPKVGEPRVNQDDNISKYIHKKCC